MKHPLTMEDRQEKRTTKLFAMVYELQRQVVDLTIELKENSRMIQRLNTKLMKED